MTRDYMHLVGRDFAWGTHDCYGLVRDFYRDIFSIELEDYARPEDFWLKGLNLFTDNYRKAGFELLERVHPSELQFGDIFISAIQSSMGNHASILVDDGKILHHLYGGISRIGPFQGLIRNTLVGTYRHRDVAARTVTEQRDIRDFLSPSKQKKLDELRKAGAETPQAT